MQHPCFNCEPFLMQIDDFAKSIEWRSKLHELGANKHLCTTRLREINIPLALGIGNVMCV